MSLRLKSILSAVFCLLAGVSLSFGQGNTVKVDKQTKPKAENKKAEKAEKPAKVVFDPKNPTVEQVAQTVLFVYGGAAGSEGLKQIRKTAIERGKMSIFNADGTTEEINYEKRVLRGETLDKDQIRFEQESPTTKYALVYKDNKIVGVYNEAVFVPNDVALNTFRNQIWHGIDSLLRQKEDGATIALDGREKYMGSEYHIIDLLDKEKRKTRYFISAKTYRVMWLEYTDNDVKYSRRFYDYRNAQGTLVPYRSVLTANGKIVEESNISTVTFGQKVEESTFQFGE